MTIREDLVVGRKVSFNTFIPAILGQRFSNAEVLGVLGYKAAFALSPNIVSIHSTGRPNFPVGVSTDPKVLDYVQLQTKDGRIHVLAFDWINPSNIVIDGAKEYSVIISNATADKMDRLRRIATIDLGLGFNYTETN